MRYVESNLMQGERVVYRAHLHWVIFFSLRALFTLLLSPLIERTTSEFAVTNRRVIIKVGLISRRTIELNLTKVESIGVNQGILGRIFGYGGITVIGTGGTREFFRGLANPLGFRRAVAEATEAVQSAMSRPTGLPA